MRRESQALGRPYATVRDNPLSGEPNDVLATLSSPEFERILVERGPTVRGAKSEIIVKDGAFVKTHGSRGWGLVKILWRHGEKSEAAPHFQVTREDIVGMTQRIREFAPVQGATKMVSKRETRWTIDNGDETRTVYTIAKRKKGAEAPTLITVFRTGRDIYGASEKRKAPYVLGGRDPSHTTGRVARGKSPNYQDTAGGGLNSLVPEAKGKEKISTGRPNVNFAVEQRENYAPAPEMEAHDAQGAREAADAATLHPLEEMTASGRMDEESARAQAASRDMAARAEPG